LKERTKSWERSERKRRRKRERIEKREGREMPGIGEDRWVAVEMDHIIRSSETALQ